MKGTAVAAAVALLLSGCDGSEDPEVLDPGPLRLSMAEDACTWPGKVGRARVQLTMVNTGEVPLTIDEVALVGAANAVLEKAMSRKKPAVDSTVTEPEGGRAQRPLVLTLRRPDPRAPMTVDEVAVEYHNVDGTFQALMSTAIQVTTEACLPSAP